MNQFIAIIPARFESTRFPGKPLADIGGKPMIRRVYERIQGFLESVVVATDDERILNAVKSFGGQAVMTSDKHKSGTDRCEEAVTKIELESQQKFDVVINVQGDEPFIRGEQIETIKSCFDTSPVQIATLIKSIEDPAIITDPNRPKVVIDNQGFALYFSRSPIPYIRNTGQNKWLEKHTFYQHIGLYAYKREILTRITQLKPSLLETAESLEQLRWLENGYRIKTAITPFESYGIDTPADLEKVIRSGLI
jgi:3-deoxy-manno-octulosonate cytidylyltransferase (CMP-KDO synthetase)